MGQPCSQSLRVVANRVGLFDSVIMFRININFLLVML